MAKNETVVRKMAGFPQDVWDKVETFQHEQKIGTEARAIRELVEFGLQVAAGEFPGIMVARLRQGVGDNLRDFSALTGIEQKRLVEIEDGGTATADEFNHALTSSLAGLELRLRLAKQNVTVYEEMTNSVLRLFGEKLKETRPDLYASLGFASDAKLDALRKDIEGAGASKDKDED